jgi:hypothetical protein
MSAASRPEPGASAGDPPAGRAPELGEGAAHHAGAAEQAGPAEPPGRMPARSSGRSGFHPGRRTPPLPGKPDFGGRAASTGVPRSGSIGVKDAQSIASPRSRLVTWSYTHLSFNGRRFCRPHPDLDRAATPALPPGGGRPLCGGRLPLLAAVPGCFAWAPQTTSPGAEPPEPPRSRARVGWRGRPGWGARDGSRGLQGTARMGCERRLAWAAGDGPDGVRETARVGCQGRLRGCEGRLVWVR